MQPAISVLIFTVSSGVGYGLFVWTLLKHVMSTEPVDMQQFLLLGVIALILVTLGLLASTLHLANPKNAWRAFHRFRTSWLSREGVFAVLFYPLILGYTWLLYLSDGEMGGLRICVALLTVLCGLATVLCTGMIYASLKPIRQWHTPLTTPIYLLFSCASGALLYLVIDTQMHARLSPQIAIICIISLLLAWLAKMLYFRIIGKPAGATINDATGFSQAQVRLLDAGHNADTFLTKEFMFDAGALRLLRLRKIMLLLTFIVPLALLTGAMQLALHALLYPALISLLAGLLVERWLFFAEARHVVRLYHGDQRA